MQEQSEEALLKRVEKRNMFPEEFENTILGQVMRNVERLHKIPEESTFTCWCEGRIKCTSSLLFPSCNLFPQRIYQLRYTTVVQAHYGYTTVPIHHVRILNDHTIVHNISTTSTAPVSTPAPQEQKVSVRQAEK